MPLTDTRSLQQIKRETEQTRAGLTDTVEQLKTSVAETASDIRHRISPEAIKAEVSGYIKSRGEQLLNDITSAARRNPMQAVAVGASVAYPLLRLARAIPLPVLMVGAGLFFAGSKTGQTVSQRASDVAADLSDDVARRARELGEQVQDTASAARTYASEQFDRVSSAIAGGTDQVRGLADAAGAAVASNSQRIKDSAASAGATLSDRASGLKDDGRRLAGSAATTVQDIADGATAAARSAASTVVDTGVDAARTIRRTASDASDQAGKTSFQTIEQNPLLVAGVGLLVGSLIASALPRSGFEDDLVGNASSAAKSRAQAAASQGLDAAKATVGEVYDETARQAEAEGLTPDGIGKAAQDISQRVRRVAEAAVTTAFEPSEQDHQPIAHGENNHG
ncbi:MAG TPA: hypothetical protein VK561_03375 [Bradyrhizobium sp.]|nr:hypothetical protein [Bradyrhizobium sp.]